MRIWRGYATISSICLVGVLSVFIILQIRERRDSLDDLSISEDEVASLTLGFIPIQMAVVSDGIGQFGQPVSGGCPVRPVLLLDPLARTRRRESSSGSRSSHHPIGM